jgi:hypothetical protein
MNMWSTSSFRKDILSHYQSPTKLSSRVSIKIMMPDVLHLSFIHKMILILKTYSYSLWPGGSNHTVVAFSIHPELRNHWLTAKMCERFLLASSARKLQQIIFPVFNWQLLGTGYKKSQNTFVRNVWSWGFWISLFIFLPCLMNKMAAQNICQHFFLQPGGGRGHCGTHSPTEVVRIATV